QHIRDLRRRAGNASDAASGAAPESEPAHHPSRRTLAKMERVLSALVGFALEQSSISGAHAEGELRWPTGVDVQTALSEVIRVLPSSGGSDAARLPDIAGAAAPRLPELR